MNRWLVSLILLLSFLARFSGVGDVESFVGDEEMFLTASKNFIESGNFSPDLWFSPPFNYYILQAGVTLFGNNPYGLRMPYVLFGTFSVLMFFLLAREVLRDVRAVSLAVLLFAIEPLNIILSRTSFIEVPAVFFLLVCVYLTARYLNGKSGSPLPAGIALGIALSLKWYFFFVSAVLLLFTVFAGAKKNGWRPTGVAHAVSVFAALPLAVYLLSYYPLFKRGYGLFEFFQMQFDIYRENQANISVLAGSPFAVRYASPWAWFIRPVISGALIWKSGQLGRFFIFMNNVPVWLLAFPSLLYMGFRAWRDRLWRPLLALALFAATYFQFLPVERPIFIYSSLVVLPFVYLAVAFLLSSLVKNNGRYYRILMVFIFLWGLYLYPLIASMPVPLSLYGPLLSLGNVM